MHPRAPSYCATGTRPTAQQLQPLATTPGMPPIQHAAVLTDRRHVLTQDAEGRVQMWDVTAGAGSPSASLWLHGKQVPHELDCCSASSSPVLPAVALQAVVAVTQPAAPCRICHLHPGPPCAGAVVRDFGQRELKDVERQLFEPSQSVSAWFAPEVRAAGHQGQP